MTDREKTEVKMLTLYNEASKKGKELIFNILLCAVTFGEPFYNEMQERLDRGDKDGMRGITEKYTAILKERGLIA